MKFTFLASATVLALIAATPSQAASDSVCPVNYDPIFCPAHSAAPVTHIDRKRAHRLLEARAEHAQHAHARLHRAAPVKVAERPAPAPTPVRVAFVEERHPALACSGSNVSVLCPGYQLLGIAY